jgi:xanthine dehydrogenase YagR molybdenum-binding subunit
LCALQCGFCTGFVVEATRFRDKWRRDKGNHAAASRRDCSVCRPSCRCAYASICKAVEEACADSSTLRSRADRVEATDKVTGRAKYTVDIALEVNSKAPF